MKSMQLLCPVAKMCAQNVQTNPSTQGLNCPSSIKKSHDQHSLYIIVCSQLQAWLGANYHHALKMSKMLYEEVADKPPTITQLVLAANNMIAGTRTTRMWRQCILLWWSKTKWPKHANIRNEVLTLLRRPDLHSNKTTQMSHPDNNFEENWTLCNFL